MSDFNTRFKSNRQGWETPASLFDPLMAEFNFTLDAAATEETAKAGKFFSVEDDGLSKDWGNNTVWLNPPYGDTRPRLVDWIKKSVDSAIKGATVVALIPARTNTNWFHDFCLKFGEVRFVRGRPKFGEADHGLPLPLCVVIFRPGVPS